MATVSLSPAGSIGLVVDLPPAELPPTAWTKGQNVSFVNGNARPALAPSLLTGALGFQPIWAMPTPLTSSQLASWILASPTKLYAYITGIVTDITRAAGGDYTGASTKRWNGGVLGGVTVVNNGTDVPQAWLAPDSATKVVDLANWPANTRARTLRSFKQFLVALNITKVGTNYPTLVKWSHPADPGAVPISWDEANPARDAGEYPLSATSGPCIDLVPLRDMAIIYKTDSVWAMQFIGGTFVFRFVKLFGDFGMPMQDCAVEYESGKHFVFTGTDFKIHDGQSAKSIAAGKIQTLLKNFSVAQLRSCYVVHNAHAQEVWFCYRKKDDNLLPADSAITWSYTDGAFGARDLPEYTYIQNGRLDPPILGVSTWATITGAWDAQTNEWGEAIQVPSVERLVGLGPQKIDWVAARPVTEGKTVLERTYQGVPMKTNTPPDLSTQKFLTRIWPRFVGKAGDVIWITLGSCDSVAQPVKWKDPRQFIIGVSQKVDVTLTGKMFAMRLESENTSSWEFSGIDAEIVASGAL